MAFWKQCCFNGPSNFQRRKNIYNGGKLSINVYQKPENSHMYIPYKNTHLRHTMKNYVIGQLKKYIRTNTEELDFLKITNRVSFKCVTTGLRKISYQIGFQGTRETEGDSLLSRVSEEIFKDTRDESLSKGSLLKKISY